MEVRLDKNTFPSDPTEEEINEIFDHHGWKVEIVRLDDVENFVEVAVPVQHEVNEWPGLSSRGHPLFLGSKYIH